MDINYFSNYNKTIPDYSRICRRINRLDNKINYENKSNLQHDDNFVIAIDSTGVKVTNRGGNGSDINGK